VRIAELIREATLEGVSDELPHSIAVTIDEMGEREDGLPRFLPVCGSSGTVKKAS
jgi:GTPase Era involved in 16S rRNA processing